jgi:hypothetical protein
VTDAPDRAYQLLRRELVRAQARLKRAERERDRALADAARLRDLLRDHGIAPPAAAPAEADDGAPDAPDGSPASPGVTRRPARS